MENTKLKKLLINTVRCLIAERRVDYATDEAKKDKWLERVLNSGLSELHPEAESLVKQQMAELFKTLEDSQEVAAMGNEFLHQLLSDLECSGHLEPLSYVSFVSAFDQAGESKQRVLDGTLKSEALANALKMYKDFRDEPIFKECLQTL